MPEDANVVAIYPDHDAAEQAVAKLRDASLDVTKLSIIRKDHTEESVVGYDTTGKRMKYLGLARRVSGRNVGAAARSRLFSNSRRRSGPLLGALVTGLVSAAIVGGLSALAAGLIHLGIPKEDAIKYENAITSDKFLVIAHGTPEEVAQARLIVGDAFVP